MNLFFLKTKSSKVKTRRGVSLAETVVYVALVALLSILVTEVILMLGLSFKNIRATRDIENSALTSLDRITREIRLADALGVGGIFGTTTGKIVLSYSGIGTTTREFFLDADRILRLKEDSVEVGALTSPNISVTSFFIEQATTSGKTILRITLLLTDKRTQNPISATFYTAAVMRSMY